ncbi:MAG: gamma-glutamylcyclotransferase family protein [Solirubrobacterales bacterium]
MPSPPEPRAWVFGYGSLVARESLGHTLEREVHTVLRAELRGWRRRWSLLRDNHTAEKTFALVDGSLPDYVLGLNVEAGGEDEAGPVNGILVELAEGELERLDRREVRYDRVEVAERISLASGDEPPARVYTYTAKRPQHFAPEAPPGSVIIARYVGIVEAGFEALGAGELDRFRLTTGPFPTEVVQASLVRDQIPPGNPRNW